jgi:hypothetical protein
VPIFKAPIENPPTFFFTSTSSDAIAETKAKQTPGWATLSDDVKQAIIDNLSTKKLKFDESKELVEEMTSFLKLLEIWKTSTFDARQAAVVKLLSGEVTEATVVDTQKLVSPTSFRILLKWVEGHEGVTKQTVKLLTDKANEATTRSQAIQAALAAKNT